MLHPRGGHAPDRDLRGRSLSSAAKCCAAAACCCCSLACAARALLLGKRSLSRNVLGAMTEAMLLYLLLRATCEAAAGRAGRACRNSKPLMMRMAHSWEATACAAFNTGSSTRVSCNDTGGGPVYGRQGFTAALRSRHVGGVVARVAPPHEAEQKHAEKKLGSPGSASSVQCVFTEGTAFDIKFWAVIISRTQGKGGHRTDMHAAQMRAARSDEARRPAQNKNNAQRPMYNNSSTQQTRGKGRRNTVSACMHAA